MPMLRVIQEEDSFALRNGFGRVCGAIVYDQDVSLGERSADPQNNVTKGCLFVEGRDNNQNVQESILKSDLFSLYTIFLE